MQNQALISLPQWQAEIEHENAIEYNHNRKFLLMRLVDRIRDLDNVKLDDRLNDGYSSTWKISSPSGDLVKLDRALSEFGNARVEGIFSPSSCFDVGGHFILKPDLLDEAILREWVAPHPLAGAYHAIFRCVLPESLVLFRSPRTSDELELLWSQLILPSYKHIIATCAPDADLTISVGLAASSLVTLRD